jgi:hypothetical protein
MLHVFPLPLSPQPSSPPHLTHPPWSIRLRPLILVSSNIIVQSGWQIRMSTSRRVPYFYNAETQASAWDKPPELSDAEVKALPGYAEHISGGGNGAAGDRPARVRASHLLVKHAGSRRPSSWKEVRPAVLPPHLLHMY